VIDAQVSDQDYLAMNSETPERIQLCEQMVAKGHAEDIAFRYAPAGPAHSLAYPRGWLLAAASTTPACTGSGICSDSPRRDDDGTPVTARRFLAVAKPGGDDDYFSFGFSHDERLVS
jgi:hypothetical protein